MSSIVAEIEQGALDSNVSLSDLLRKCLSVASKLALDQPIHWVEAELNGYTGNLNVPDYRVLYGDIRMRNPYHGWQPFMIEDAEFQKMISECKLGNPIREIEHLIVGDSGAQIELTGDMASKLCRMANMPTVPIAVFMPSNLLLRIPDTIRTKILTWTLELQRAGIVGEGLSFSPKEKAAAQNPGVIFNVGNIGSFSGNIGGQVGRDVNSTSHYTNCSDMKKIAEFVRQVRELDEQMGLPDTAKAELRAYVDELEGELQSEKPHVGKLARLLTSVKSVAEGATGNLISAGVVALANSIQF